jgi:Ran GTPase-activating protein (RanGAP) involved in mRNA processing and transport
VLRTLDLSYGFENLLLQEHSLVFSDFIRKATNLKTLKLEGNGFGEIEKEQIERILLEDGGNKKLKLKI